MLRDGGRFRPGIVAEFTEIRRRKPCIKNRVEEAVEKAVVEFAVERPACGQLRASNELKKA
ncbi:MAG: hypothetical protein KJP05_08705, partial [Deltaproteobacteria bacterium]|nr:hypothetical protein [Deltaproteobacteria bacterium]